MSRRTKNPTVNVAVPRDEHRAMKREAAARGMQLKEYQRYVLLMARTAPAELHRQTYEQFVSQQSARHPQAA